VPEPAVTARRVVDGVPTALVLVLAAAWLAYAARSLLASDPLLTLDDGLLVRPLAEVRTPADYAALREAHRVWDVQPVRDLSYWVDLRAKSITGLPAHHLSNLVVWLGIVVLAWRILLHIGVGPLLAVSLAAALAFHPALLQSAGWVAARKHLLSCFFTLAATLACLRGVRTARSAAGAAALHALAVLSHPVNVLWSAWMALHVRSHEPRGNRRAALAGTAAAAAVGAGVAVWNLLYYRTAYVAQTGSQEKLSPDALPLRAGEGLLSLGMHFFVLAKPTALKLFYYEPSDRGAVAGAVLLSLACAGALAHPRRRELLAWVVFALLPLAVVAFPHGNIFASDTYVLVPAVGFVAAAGIALQSLPPLPRRLAPALPLALALAGAAMAPTRLSLWESDETFCARMSQAAPNPQVLACHGQHLLAKGRLREVEFVAERLMAEWPGFRGGIELLAMAVGRDPALSAEQKLARLSGIAQRTPLFAVYLARLHAARGDYASAYGELAAQMAAPGPFAYFGRDELEEAVAEFLYDCAAAGGADCTATARHVREALTARPWDEARFRARIAALGRSAGAP